MNTSEKLLSVIVPIYGVEEYLNECIDSILEQSYINLEIILVDDGAKGREPEICDEYALKDSRIKVIHKKNAGLIAARKTGIENATGDYVIFIDGDDYIAPDYYERMMHQITTNDADLVAVSFNSVRGGKCFEELQNVETGVYQGASLETLLSNMNCFNEEYYKFGIWPSTCMKIYKTDILREIITSIPENIRLGEDSAVSFPYILKCKKIVIDNTNTGYYYRIIAGSMARTCDESLFRGTDSLYKFLKPFYLQAFSDKVLTQLEYTRAYLIGVALNMWMSGASLKNVNNRIRQLRNIVQQTELFCDKEKLRELKLPEDLKEKIELIANNDWRGFEYKWKKRLALSYLHTMARKILRRA